MAKPLRSYSRQNIEAVEFFAEMIRAGRIERKITTRDMARRAGVSRTLLQRIEEGDPRCAIGAVFEVAVIAGVTLFEADPDRLQTHRAALREKLSLLPKHARKSKRAGVLQRGGNQLLFNYGRSYLARENAISIYEPELPLQAGDIPLADGLSMPGCIRDASPRCLGETCSDQPRAQRQGEGSRQPRSW